MVFGKPCIALLAQGGKKNNTLMLPRDFRLCKPWLLLGSGGWRCAMHKAEPPSHNEELPGPKHQQCRARETQVG